MISGIATQAQATDIGGVLVIEWNPQGTQYAIAGNFSSCNSNISNEFDVIIIDATSNMITQHLTGNRCPIYDIAWNYDGTRIATNSAGRINVWNVTTGEMLSTTNAGSNGSNVGSVNWHPSQNLLLYTVRFGNVGRSGNSFITGDQFTIVGDVYTATTFFTDAKWYGTSGDLIIGEQDGDIVIWDVESNSELSTIATHPSPPYLIEISPNNEFIATTNRQDGIVSIIDISGQDILFQLTVDWVGDIAWNSDSTYVAVTATDYLQIYEIASGRLVEEFQYPDRIYSVAWYPNSNRLLIGGHDSLLTEVVTLD